MNCHPRGCTYLLDLRCRCRVWPGALVALDLFTSVVRISIVLFEVFEVSVIQGIGSQVRRGLPEFFIRVCCVIDEFERAIKVGVQRC